jgi:hypothetical protein
MDWIERYIDNIIKMLSRISQLAINAVEEIED